MPATDEEREVFRGHVGLYDVDFTTRRLKFGTESYSVTNIQALTVQLHYLALDVRGAGRKEAGVGCLITVAGLVVFFVGIWRDAGPWMLYLAAVGVWVFFHGVKANRDEERPSYSVRLHMRDGVKTVFASSDAEEVLLLLAKLTESLHPTASM